MNLEKTSFWLFTAEETLLLMIGCIVFVSLLFFFMTLIKKVDRIKELKRKKEYQEIIDNLFFELMFTEMSPRDISESSEYLAHKEKRLFQQLTIKNLRGLHDNYSGSHSKKLEQFFAESGLALYSLKKLNSDNWAHVVEGIRDLSSLNYMPAYSRIVSYQNHQNKFVKTEVLLGLIKLKGISELLKFKKSKVYFNDWVQSNILYVVKNHKIPAPENLPELLESKNTSILLLAVRLINFYGLPEHYIALSKIYEKIDNPGLKKEMALLLDRTQQLQ